MSLPLVALAAGVFWRGGRFGPSLRAVPQAGACLLFGFVTGTPCHRSVTLAPAAMPARSGGPRTRSVSHGDAAPTAPARDRVDTRSDRSSDGLGSAQRSRVDGQKEFGQAQILSEVGAPVARRTLRARTPSAKALEASLPGSARGAPPMTPPLQSQERQVLSPPSFLAQILTPFAKCLGSGQSLQPPSSASP